MTHLDPDPKSISCCCAAVRRVAALLPQLELFEMPLASAVRIGTTPQPRLFPDHVDRLAPVCDGERSSAEIAVVGNEGIVGISSFRGGESTPSRAVVQSAVTATD